VRTIVLNACGWALVGIGTGGNPGALRDCVRSGSGSGGPRLPYSPDITTFGSADNLTDLEARIEARLGKRLIGFAGHRWFRMDLLMREERDLQNEIFAGARWQLK
jgi:hypothetical protein